MYWGINLCMRGTPAPALFTGLHFQAQSQDALCERQGSHGFLKSIIINNVMNTRNSLRNTKCVQDASTMEEKNKQLIYPLSLQERPLSL